MRKAIVISGSILLFAILVLVMIRRVYKDSPDYNYISAKLDIKKGDLKIIHTGYRKTSSKDKEIDAVTGSYGFKNVYVGNDIGQQVLSGINNYNEVMEAYLKIRNGRGWREKYQRSIDSLYNR